jgi:hypothetical protein
MTAGERRAGLRVANAGEACIDLLSAPNEASVPAVVVIVVSAVRVWLSVLMVVDRSEGLTAAAALTMRSATACGCETMISCEPCHERSRPASKHRRSDRLHRSDLGR